MTKLKNDRLLRALLRERDGVDPDEVIMTPDRASRLGVTSTVCFPRGNLAPEGSVIKSTAIDEKTLDPDGCYRKTGRAKVFVRETDAIAAEPASDGFSPDDLAASFFTNIGISPKSEFRSNIGRPITLVQDGTPIGNLH